MTITVDNALTYVNGSGSAISSISNVDGTLTISPTTGAVVASLNLANANTWSGAQTFSTAPLTITTGGSASTAPFLTNGALFTGGTGTTTFPYHLLQPSTATPNTTWSVNGTFIGINTAAGFTGSFIDCHINGGTSVFGVGSSGNMNAGSLSTSGNITSGGTLRTTVSGSLSISPLSTTGALFTGGSGTTTFPMFRQEQTGATAVTTWSTAGTWWGVNASSGFTGNFIDFHTNGGASLYSVDSNGLVIAASSFLSGGSVQAAAAFSFSVQGRSRMKSSADGTMNFRNNADNADSGIAVAGIAQSAKTTLYNNVTTTGWGSPAIYASGRSTAQTAAVASVSTYTVGAADGTFLVSANALVTASVTNNFTVTCAYTDEGNNARTLTLTFSQVGGTLLTAITNITGVGPYEGIPLHIRCKASTAITIATTGTFTSVTYNVEGYITQIG